MRKILIENAHRLVTRAAEHFTMTALRHTMENDTLTFVHKFSFSMDSSICVWMKEFTNRIIIIVFTMMCWRQLSRFVFLDFAQSYLLLVTAPKTNKIDRPGETKKRTCSSPPTTTITTVVDDDYD